MAITKTVQAPISKGLVNSLSDSISLQAGDLLIYAIHNRDNHQFSTPVWNGQTLTQAASLSPLSYFRVYYVLASSTATANLTSTATGFTDTNVAWVSFRSSTNSFTSTPFRDVETLSYTSGTYTNPSVTLAGLVAGDNVVSFLAWSGWNTGFGNVQSTTAVESNLTAEGVVQNSTHQNTPGRTYLSSGTGYTGNTVVGYTKSGAGSPVHGMIAIAVQESSQLINTITDPLVPNSAISGTCTGFADGAATISFSGVSIPVTITSGSFSGTVPMLADGIVWPRLPAVGQTVTLTQSSNTATASVGINLPTGHQTLRVGDVVGGAVANFADVVTDNDRMLGYHFLAAVNPLTTDDTAYFVTSDNYWVYRNGDVGADTASLPRTDTLYIQDTTTGVISSHSVVLTEAGGGIIVTPVDSNVTFKTGRLEAKESLATFRAKLPFQAQSVAADVPTLRTDFNSLLTKMTNAGWFEGGDEQFTMIKIALQCGLPQLVKRIKEQAPDQMPVQAASVAADVAGLRTDLNALLTKLKNSNLMANS